LKITHAFGGSGKIAAKDHARLNPRPGIGAVNRGLPTVHNVDAILNQTRRGDSLAWAPAIAGEILDAGCRRRDRE